MAYGKTIFDNKNFIHFILRRTQDEIHEMETRPKCTKTISDLKNVLQLKIFTLQLIFYERYGSGPSQYCRLHLVNEILNIDGPDFHFSYGQENVIAGLKGLNGPQEIFI